MKAKTVDRIIIAFVVLLLLWGCAHLMGVGKKDTEGANTDSAQELTWEDYDGKTIGILTGTNMEQESFDHFPHSRYLYFDGYPNLNGALENGIIDAYLGDEPALKSIHAASPR